QEVRRAGGLRLRRRVRLLDLPRLRQAGVRLALRARGEGGGHPRQGVRRARDLASRLPGQGRRRGRGRRDYPREPAGLARRAPRPEARLKPGPKSKKLARGGYDRSMSFEFPCPWCGADTKVRGSERASWRFRIPCDLCNREMVV